MMYEMFKVQFVLIIQSLFFYVVVCFNLDRLEELVVSIKIEVWLDDYRGVMEEDELVCFV